MVLSWSLLPGLAGGGGGGSGGGGGGGARASSKVRTAAAWRACGLGNGKGPTPRMPACGANGCRCRRHAVAG